MTKTEIAKTVELVEEIAESTMCLQGTVARLARDREWAEAKAVTSDADIARLRGLTDSEDADALRAVDDLAADVTVKATAFAKLSDSPTMIKALQDVRTSIAALTATLGRDGAIGQEVETPRKALRLLDRGIARASKVKGVG